MTARVPSLSHGEPYGTIPLWCRGGTRLQDNIIVKPSVEKQFDRFLRQGRVLFFSAPCGFGKTAVAEALLSSREVLRLPADSAGFKLPSAEADWQILLLDDLQDMQEEQDWNALCELIHSGADRRFVLLSPWRAAGLSDRLPVQRNGKILPCAAQSNTIKPPVR